MFLRTGSDPIWIRKDGAKLSYTLNIYHSLHRMYRHFTVNANLYKAIFDLMMFANFAIWKTILQFWTRDIYLLWTSSTHLPEKTSPPKTSVILHCVLFSSTKALLFHIKPTRPTLCSDSFSPLDPSTARGSGNDNVFYRSFLSASSPFWSLQQKRRTLSKIRKAALY